MPADQGPPPYDDLALIAACDVAGFDETRFRVEGRLRWVHCARTSRYTLLMVHSRRGAEAMEAMGVLPSFAGTAALGGYLRVQLGPGR